MRTSLRKRISAVRAHLQDFLVSLPLFLYPKLWSLYRYFRNHPDAVAIIGARDAFRLYHMVRKKRPRRILELGTGIGTATAVLALASPDADIISFEQEEKCVAIARKIIPHHLQSRVTVLYSPLFVFSLPAISPYLFFSGYRDISLTEDFFDFVVIDGPASWMEKGKLITLMNGDIIPILPLLLPGALVYIDHRKDVSSFCKRFLSLSFSACGE